MRKTKEFKRLRRQAATQYRRGEKTEAYKTWAEATKGMADLKTKKAAKRAAKKKTAGAATPAA